MWVSGVIIMAHLLKADSSSAATAESQSSIVARRIHEATSKVDDQWLRDADSHPGDWMTTGLNYSEAHYSLLNEITTENVGQLGLLLTLGSGQTIDSLRCLPRALRQYVTLLTVPIDNRCAIHRLLTVVSRRNRRAILGWLPSQ